MKWDLATDVILASAIVTLMIFAILGLYQLITRRSFKRVDRPILFMLIPLTLMLLTYLFFDKFLIINTRPNGSGESSFPSTHVMVVGTIFSLVSIALLRYLKNRKLYGLIVFIMATLLILTCIGRVISNMHWLSDVIAGIIFSAIFAFIYYLTLKGNKHE